MVERAARGNGAARGSSPRPVARAAARALMLGGAALGIGYGAARLRDEALASERFGLVSVAVRGAVRVTPDDVRRASGLRPGQNVLALDLDAVERTVEGRLSWVREARARRVLPGQIAIEVEEHQPVALLSLGDLFYLDASGRAFRVFVQGEALDLPILFIGLDGASYERGDPEAVARIQTGLEFIRSHASTLGPGEASPRSVEVGAAGLVRYVTASGAAVTVGPPPWAAALERARHTLAALAAEPRSGLEVVVGRGRREDRAFVRTVDPAPIPPEER